MKFPIPAFIKWRYDLYCAEHVDLYGSLGFFLKHKLNNARQLKHPNLAYVYANKRNVGDYISHQGIKELVKEPGVELFCTPVWQKQFDQCLDEIKAKNPNCLLVIGGGGLLQPVFRPFWQKLLTSGLPYVLFGIGINKMEGRPSMEPEEIKRIANQASLIGVRDQYTFDQVKAISGREAYMGICPSVNYVHRHFWRARNEHAGPLLHMYHPSDVRLAGADLESIRASLKAVAIQLGREYTEHSNMTSNSEGMLKRVQQAGIVVSSRLHGCIMSFSTGTPFVPLLCDDKIRSFCHTHAKVEGYQPQVFHDKEAAAKAISHTLENHTNQKQEIAYKLEKNAEFAAQIRAMIDPTEQ